MSATTSDPSPNFSTLKRRFLLKKRATIAAVVVLALCVLAIAIPAVFSPSPSLQISPRSSGVATAQGRIGEEAPVASATHMMVHVVGAVKKPGLILVDSGARVIDAVLRAGGMTPTADQCAINLARALVDGEQVFVSTALTPGVACASVSSPSNSGHTGPSGKVSLSRGTLEQFDSLPGVGPALAQRIIDWRNAHGGFTSVEQLDEVSGIGEKVLLNLAPLVVP